MLKGYDTRRCSLQQLLRELDTADPPTLSLHEKLQFKHLPIEIFKKCVIVRSRNETVLRAERISIATKTGEFFPVRALAACMHLCSEEHPV
jgi:hypothetical protein